MARVLDQPCRFCNYQGQEASYGSIYSSDEGVFEQSAAEDVCDKCAFLKEVVRCCIVKGFFVSGTAKGGIHSAWYGRSDSVPMEGDAPKECDFPSRWSKVQFEPGGDYGTQFEVFTLPGLPKPFFDFPIKNLPELTSSDNSLKTVQGWLETCDRSHKSCLPQRAGLKTALPKRVLDLSAPLVRLYETHGESARYACLSHCWGATRPACRTTSKKGSPENPSATLEENRKGIEWNALPATFRDAIDFTRRLGIRYLWIDSICIIQDDIDDWSEQSGKMANIYENSYITLCATASSSDDGGCYSHTPPHWELRRIRARTRDNTEYEVYVRHQLEERHLPQWHFAGDDESPLLYPLMTRAWTYQERLLSSRLVHFTAGEIMWECEELSTCECSRPGTTNEKSEYRRAISVPEEEHGEELIKGWHDMVGSYSALNLSFEKDKLPALSGLAQQILTLRPGDQYLAGMWRSSLLSDLCWRIWNPSKSRSSVWRSPSWSWASIDGSVEYLGIRLRIEADYCTCVDVSATPSGHDPTGELSSAYIVLSAPVMMARIQESDKWGEHSLVSEAGMTIDHIGIDCQADFENGSLAVGDSLLCLALARNAFDRVFCLILKQRGGDDNFPIYERVGWTDAIEPHEIDEFMETKTVKIV